MGCGKSSSVDIKSRDDHQSQGTDQLNPD